MPPPKGRSASVSRLASSTANSRQREEDTKQSQLTSAGTKRKAAGSENIAPEAKSRRGASASAAAAAAAASSANLTTAAAAASSAAAGASASSGASASAAAAASASDQPAHLSISQDNKVYMVVNGVAMPVDLPLEVTGKARRTINEQLLLPQYKNQAGMKNLLIKVQVWHHPQHDDDMRTKMCVRMYIYLSL